MHAEHVWVGHICQECGGWDGKPLDSARETASDSTQ